MYTIPSQMEPMLPSTGREALTELAVELVRRSASLGSLVRPELKGVLVELLRQMNSYYSNLIEGHATHPLDIERALRRDYSTDSAMRALQLESRAHTEVEKLIERRLDEDADLEICAPSFLRWIHREFYGRMPVELRVVSGPAGETATIEPGELRRREVRVGDHVPPVKESLERFFARFEEVYSPERLSGLDRVVAAAASHHRLAWIHPFMDGNGRVTRLFTHAYLQRVEIGGHRLWTMTRGLGRRRAEYLAALRRADAPRQGDLDGRGNLSDRGLSEFCRFFLETALDQVSFMSGLLDIEGFERRVLGHVERRAARGELRPEAGVLLRDVLVRGAVPRGEAARISGLGERVARQVVSQLTREGLLRSETPKGPLRIGLPVNVVPYYFPRLYPPDVEVSMEEGRLE